MINNKSVNAGMDCIFAFVKTVYPNGQALFDRFAKVIEYETHENAC